MKIYVASSWRNQIQQDIVRVLRRCSFDVYDFKNPDVKDKGFHWSEIDPDWKKWSPEKFRESLDHPLAISGFKKDMDALKECDCCVLVMPCGRSAHLELGYAIGACKRTIILLSDGEPELMYKMVDKVCCSPDELVRYLTEGF